MSAEELDREAGEEQTTVGWIRRKKGSGRITWAGHEETREATADMGGLCKRDVRKAGEGEAWKKKTRHRGGRKILSDEAVKKLRDDVRILSHQSPLC